MSKAMRKRLDVIENKLDENKAISEIRQRQNLVNNNKGSITTDSLVFSQEFQVTHRDITKKIKNLTAIHTQVKDEFILSTFTNERNRTYEMYHITKRGFLTLLMQYGNAKSETSMILIFEKQQLFITAFEKMEQMLLNSQNLEWKAEREQGKNIRKSETDAIKDFIEYAISNGSKSAKHYYTHFTKATYKALGLLASKNPKIRDTLNLLQLHQLVIAEDIVTRVIKNEMKKGEQYKIIYEKAKLALDKFSEVLYINK